MFVSEPGMCQISTVSFISHWAPPISNINVYLFPDKFLLDSLSHISHTLLRQSPYPQPLAVCFNWQMYPLSIPGEKSTLNNSVYLFKTSFIWSLEASRLSFFQSSSIVFNRIFFLLSGFLSCSRW